MAQMLRAVLAARPRDAAARFREQRPAALARLVAQGLLTSDARGLRLTAAGWPLANAVLAEIAR